MTGNQVKESGLVIHKTYPFLACSPDGVVSSEKLIEIKCPYSCRDKPVTPETVPYLTNNDGELNLKTTHGYYYQVQGQLLCTGAQEVNFVVFSKPSDSVTPDLKIIISREMKASLNKC